MTKIFSLGFLLLVCRGFSLDMNSLLSDDKPLFFSRPTQVKKEKRNKEMHSILETIGSSGYD